MRASNGCSDRMGSASAEPKMLGLIQWRQLISHRPSLGSLKVHRNIHLGSIGNGPFARYEIGLKIYLEKYEIVPIFLRSVPQKEDNLLRISLADSCANGFNKWCSAHDAGRKEDSRTSADHVIVGDQAVDHVVTTLSERPHRP